MSLLVGVEYCKMDAQGRFKIPVAIKKQLDIASDNRFFVRHSIYDNNLELFTYEAFQQEVAYLQGNLNTYDPDSKKLYRRMIEGNMVEMDAFDRILVPDNLRQLAHLSKEIVLIGSGKYLELWDSTIYKKTCEDNFDYKQAAKNLLSKANDHFE